MSRVGAELKASGRYLARTYFGVTSWADIEEIGKSKMADLLNRDRINGYGHIKDTPKGHVSILDKKLAMGRMTGLYPPVEHGVNSRAVHS